MNTTTDDTEVSAASPDMEFNAIDESVWMFLWIFSMIVFLCLPFCITSNRRKLCIRRIRERRWIPGGEEEEDDWYMQVIRRRQEEMVQRTRTQQDEINEQYLLEVMKPYTMVRLKL